MAKEEATGTDQAGNADQNTGNNDATTDVQKGDTQDTAGNQDDKVKGLTAGIVAEREKRQGVEAENQTLRDQMALQPQTAQQPVKQESLSQAVAKQLGIDMEYATPGEICQINEGVLQIMSGQQSEQTFINSHPDYAEVVGITLPNGMFQPATPLTRELKANPIYAEALKNSPNKAVFAYAIASKNPQYLTELAESAKSGDTKAAELAEAKIKAANKQLSISDAKGGGGNLDQAAATAAMSDEEFRKHNDAIMAKAT